MLNRISTQIGQTELDGPNISRAVVDYFFAAGQTIRPDGQVCPYWGGALLAWVAVKDGLLPPIGAANPLAWVEWGGPLLVPTAGSVVVLTGGAGLSQRQVAVVGRAEARKIYVVGPHDGTVQIYAAPMDRVIAARRPPGSALGITLPSPEIVPTTIEPHQQVTVPVYASPPPAPHQGEVSIDALQRLLATVQDEFRAVHDRIGHVERTAVATVDLRPVE